MAAKEIYDYVDEATVDHDKTLSVSPRAALGGAVLDEIGEKPDVVYEGDDNDPASETRIDFSGGDVTFYIYLRWDLLNEADAGTIMQFWCDPDYGCGKIYTFKFSHPDGHTYVVRFESKWQRSIRPTTYGVPVSILAVIGKILDA